MLKKECLVKLYDRYGILDSLARDYEYLTEAYKEITQLWAGNLNKIKTVNYIMLSEAPLWGVEKNYFYNLNSGKEQTAFFRFGNLKDIVEEKIHSKEQLIKACNAMGLLVLDLFPYAFNSSDTKVCYKGNKNYKSSIEIKDSDYQELFKSSFEWYLKPLFIKAMQKIEDNNLTIFYRYVKLYSVHHDLKLLLEPFYRLPDELPDISMQGGFIDNAKIKRVILGDS